MSKRLMKEALLELLEERPVEKISVTDICKTADVNRSTFYANYETIDQLIEEIENDVLCQLPMVDGSKEENWESLEAFLDYVKRNERVFRVLFVRQKHDDFHQSLIRTVVDWYQRDKKKNSFLEQYTYTCCVYGVFGVIKVWISDGFPVSTKELAEFIRNMVIGVFK